jgi:hypothetical protein
MFKEQLQKLEGVWTGMERVLTEAGWYEATGRWEFRTLFDGRFLLADYVQTAPDKPTSVGHGVFRKDDATEKLTVTWFRSPAATETQQGGGVADGNLLIFVENTEPMSRRTTYAVSLNRLTIVTEGSTAGGEWTTIFDGAYRRPR